MTNVLDVTQDNLLIGSLVSLQSQYGAGGGFLSTCGSASTTAIFRNWPVSQLIFTTDSPYGGGAGLWRIVSDTKRDGDPLQFGDLIHLRNGAPGQTFLDTCGYARYVAELKDLNENIVVFASSSPDRFHGSGTWKVMSAAGKADGEPVLSGDTLSLMNLFPDGGFLDVCGSTKNTASFASYDAIYMVFTSASRNRDGGSGTWRIRAEERRMLMLMRGALEARATPPLSAGDFTVSLMIEPASAGAIVQGPDFGLSLQADGTLKLTILGRSGDGTATWVTSAPTAVLASGRCHLVTCLVPRSGDPAIYLDGQPLATNVSFSRARAAVVPEASLTLGSPETGGDLYTGGLMNLGIWSRLLSPSDLRLAGSGFLTGFEEGLVGFWPLSTSLKDCSAAANAFSPLETPVAEYHFTPCNDCVAVDCTFSSCFRSFPPAT